MTAPTDDPTPTTGGPVDYYFPEGCRCYIREDPEYGEMYTPPPGGCPVHSCTCLGPAQGQPHAEYCIATVLGKATPPEIPACECTGRRPAGKNGGHDDDCVMFQLLDVSPQSRRFEAPITPGPHEPNALAGADIMFYPANLDDAAYFVANFGAKPADPAAFEAWSAGALMTDWHGKRHD